MIASASIQNTIVLFVICTQTEIALHICRLQSYTIHTNLYAFSKTVKLKVKNYLCDLLSFKILTIFICSIMVLVRDKVYFEYKANERNQARWSIHPSNSIYDIS